MNMIIVAILTLHFLIKLRFPANTPILTTSHFHFSFQNPYPIVVPYVGKTDLPKSCRTQFGPITIARLLIEIGA